MKQLILVLFLIFQHPIFAQELAFQPPMTVVELKKHGFIHLDSSGRHNVAVSYQNASSKQTIKTIAVVWEDNHSGISQIYVSYLKLGQKGFSAPLALTKKTPAYEPSVTGLAGGRFVVAWEQDNRIWARVINHRRQGKAISWNVAAAKQISLASNGKQRVGAVWSEKEPVNQSTEKHAKRRYFRIRYAPLKITGFQIAKPKSINVDVSLNRRDQLYPAFGYTQSGVMVGWEDRRHGATRMYYASAMSGKLFSKAKWLNPRKRNPNLKYGKGIGSMRIGISSDGKNYLACVWMDKRNWRSGYDVFTAFSQDGGKSMGKNILAQDMLGNNIPQWHGAIAVNPKTKQAVTIWDDTRDGSADLWYSVSSSSGWSDDYTFASGSGDGSQSNPSIQYDQDGILHIVWIDKNNKNTRIRYIQSK